MTVRPVLVVGEPVLHRATRPVTPEEIGGDALHALVTDLFETMDAARGVGLAANQIGDDRRVFVYDCPDEAAGGGRRSEAELDPVIRRRGVVVNPVLETTERPETMPDPDDDDEGCLSVPGEVFATGRASWARVTGTDADGEPVSVAGEGYLARCLQHETDHLDGFVYVDRLVGRHRRAAKRALRSHGWGVPGHSWMPGVDPDPFGH